MSISNFRSVDAMYLIIVRDRNAEQLLKSWVQENRSSSTVDKNRMKLYDSRSLNLFQVSWSHNWDNVMIWDYWNRRHIGQD